MSDWIGRTLGPYQITAELGHGGMANVYRAVQASVKREVAIKVLPAHFLQDRSFLTRFNREAEVIARLQHPRILPIYDFGEYEGLPYIVMAYMPGGTLADLIEASPDGMPLDDVTRLVAQIAEGLDFLHREGIIHRDFKPSNVLLDKEGNAHIADFGIAKVTAETAQLTGSGIVGTPQYMAPEISNPDGPTPAIDIYALGVTLYQTVTGRHPFEAPTPMGVLLAHASKPIPDARERRPNLPDAVQGVIETAMAKNPANRYASAGQMAKALSAAILQAPSGQPETLAMKPLPQSPTAPRERRPMSKSALRWIGVAVAAALVIFGATIAMWRLSEFAASLSGPPTEGATQPATEPTTQPAIAPTATQAAATDTPIPPTPVPPSPTNVPPTVEPSLEPTVEPTVEPSLARVENWTLVSTYVSSDPCSGAATVDVTVPITLHFDNRGYLQTLDWYSRSWVMSTSDGTNYSGTAVVEDSEFESIIDTINLVFTSPQTFDGDFTRTVTSRSTSQVCKAYATWHGTQP